MSCKATKKEVINMKKAKIFKKELMELKEKVFADLMVKYGFF